MSTTDPIAPSSSVDTLLTDEMLARFDERAPIYDRENRFFDEDFAELRESGYLSCALPAEYGGSGLGLLGYTKLARRLAYVAPATALAVNMHVYWTGVAADLLKMGDDSCRFILEKAADGEIFAAIHGEPGNDMPLLLSTTTAERVDGRLEAQRPQDLRQPHPGLDVRRLPRHGQLGPRQPPDRARVPAPGHARAADR